MTNPAILIKPYLKLKEPLAPLVLCIYLQMLDVLTTMAFLLGGVEEGNPLVRWAMQSAPNPLSGLLAVKVAAVLLGAACWWTGRQRALRRVNVFFSALVAWNLICLILGLAFPKA